MVIEQREELRDAAREVPVDLRGAVDLLVVLALCPAHLGKALLAHLDARLAQAVLDHVRDKGAKRPGVVRTAKTVVEALLGAEARADGVLAVLAHVGNDVRDAHHAALKRHGAQVCNGGTALLPALLHPAVELVEAGKRACLKNLLLELAVVADHAIQRLECEVPAIGDVEHANALHVVRKEAAGAGMVDVV